MTPALRRTGVGSAPALWNLLDNAKRNYELAMLGQAALEDHSLDEEEPAAATHAGSEARHEPPPDAWERFQALASQRASGLGVDGLNDEL
jgi:hypothetical protein